MKKYDVEFKNVDGEELGRVEIEASSLENAYFEVNNLLEHEYLTTYEDDLNKQVIRTSFVAKYYISEQYNIADLI